MCLEALQEDVQWLIEPGEVLAALGLIFRFYCMRIAVIHQKEIKRQATERAKAYLHYGSKILQRWGTVTKPIRDNQMKQIKVARYR